MKRKNETGLALPMAITLLLIVSLIGFGVVMKNTKTDKLKMAKAKMNTSYTGALQAATQMAEFQLKRPDNPSLNHKWTKNSSSTNTITVNGKTVQVRIEDLEVSKQ